ncbi:hypothetical protein VTL71DRAFT_14018 [Oculimacula yallundae]|uniref:Gustatory receptor n=1 Tax=Oculimacula yallundae TaxID=86028 RepID=A0ABR4CMK3_9HELO
MAVASFSERLKLHATAWLSNLLGLALFTLTIAYACGSYSMTGFRRVRTSLSKTILVLRVLSELTSILLTITLGLTLENIKWRLVTLFKDLSLPNLLSLVPGTSVVGLIQLVLSKGPAWSSWHFWSFGRLFLLALIPILNIIIFRLNACFNTESLIDSDCVRNRDWSRSLAPKIAVQVSVRNATVGFSRLNSTIQMYELADSWSKPDISGTDILAAFDGFFGTSNSEATDDFSQIFGSFLEPPNAKSALVAIVNTIAVECFYYGSRAAIAHNIYAAQALLTITLYYCSGVFGSGIPSRESVLANGSVNITELVKISLRNFPEATYSLASTSHNLVVGSNSIQTYAILGGLFLLVNFGITCFCTFTDSGQKRPP